MNVLLKRGPLSSDRDGTMKFFSIDIPKIMSSEKITLYKRREKIRFTGVACAY